ncbi:MAG: tetratricopeptide repeat protein [Myxococcota bacterium]
MPASACPEENEILDFVEGRLRASAVAQMHAHFDTCAPCSALLADLGVLSGVGEGTPAALRSDSTAGAARRAPTDDFIPPGTRLGRYVVQELVGAGAMGAVYRAEDPELARAVAIKALHRGAGPSPADFGREARALARLEHEHVVSVFDFGNHGGRSYLVLEFFEGKTLQAWLKAEHAPSRALAVMRAAASGLQAAHDAGIVHRDFKPSNVMVSDEGRVAVTDFGLAVGGDQLRAESTVPSGFETGRTRSPAGTPAYMAPEQLAGETGTPRSDQFSFFVATYEALIGERPQLHADRHVQFGALAPVVGVRAARAILRGLRPHPADRHASVATGARQLATRPSPRWMVAGTVGLVGLAAASFAMLGEPPPNACAVAAADHPWDDTARARLRSAFEATDDAYASTAWASVEPVLDAHRAAWAVAADRSCTERSVAISRCLRDAEREAAATLRTLDGVDGNALMQAAAAVRQLTPPASCFRGERWREAGGDDPRHAGARAALIESQVLGRLGRFHRGLEMLDRAQELAKPLSDGRLHARLHYVRARFIARVESPAAAVPIYERAYSDALAEGHDDVAALAALGLVRVHSAGLGDLNGARSWLRHARSSVVRSGRHRGEWLGEAAAIAAAEGHPDEALRAFVGATLLLAWDRGVGSPAFASGLQNIAGQLAYLEHHQVAIGMYRMVIERLTKIVGAAHPRVANASVNLGISLTTQARYDEAQRACEGAAQTLEAVFGADRFEVVFPLQCLAEVQIARGRWSEAEATLTRVVAIEAKTLDPESMHHALTRGIRGTLALAQGRNEEAGAVLRQSLREQERVLSDDDPVLGYTILLLGDVALQMGELDHARARYERAVEIFDPALAADDPFTVAGHAGLAEVLVDQGHVEEGVAALETVYGIVSNQPGAPADRARIAFALARGLARTDPDSRRVDALLGEATLALKDHEPSWLSRRIDAWAVSRRSRAAGER